jgi:hypothetical protein
MSAQAKPTKLYAPVKQVYVLPNYSLPEGFCIYFNLNLKKAGYKETLLRQASYTTVYTI